MELRDCETKRVLIRTPRRDFLQQRVVLLDVAELLVFLFPVLVPARRRRHAVSRGMKDLELEASSSWWGFVLIVYSQQQKKNLKHMPILGLLGPDDVAWPAYLGSAPVFVGTRSCNTPLTWFRKRVLVLVLDGDDGNWFPEALRVV